MLGLPLTLMEEEVLLLLRRKVARIVKGNISQVYIDMYVLY